MQGNLIPAPQLSLSLPQVKKPFDLKNIGELMLQATLDVVDHQVLNNLGIGLVIHVGGSWGATGNPGIDFAGNL